MEDVLTVVEYLPVALAGTVAAYLPAALTLVGVVLIGYGLRALRPRGAPRSWPAWARTYLHAFRGMVVGACLLGAAWGWSAHIGWLFAASVCIAIGEFLESSYYDVVLEWGARTRKIHGGDSF